MRFDLDGIFWEDMPPVSSRSKSERVRPIPPIPDTGWTPPKEFPNIFHAPVLGVDVETYDPELKTHGPGWARSIGEIVGFSIATSDGHKWYFPIRHQIQTEFNLDPESVIRFMQDILRHPMPKVGANIVYDLGWMLEENIVSTGPFYDVSYAEAILFDTARSYSLNSIATRWLGQQKTEADLYAWSAQAYGGRPVRNDQAENIYRCPPALVGPYAEDDALLPLKILPLQWKALQEQQLLQVFDLETRLIPMLLGMRKRGVYVDIERTENAKLILEEKEREAQQTLNTEAGFSVGVFTPNDLQHLFDKKHIKYPRTKKGAPSFTKDWLSSLAHPIGKLVNNVRKYNKTRITFIENAILNKHVDGIVYPSFHPLRGEEGGAGSGRYSSSNPNIQQMTERDKELKPLVRGCFIPEPGFGSWIKQDLSQIEYRKFAHFSDDSALIAAYQHRDTDFHAVVSAFLGDLIPRTPVKNFNFMSLYGGGESKAVEMLRAVFTKEQAEILLLDLGQVIKSGDVFRQLGKLFVSMYNEKFPAANKSLERDMLIAERTGEIRTILGRRSTFDLWEPRVGKKPGLPRDIALREYGYHIKRAYCYRALNRRLQGSAADFLKKGMLLAYEEGIFHRIGFPHVTVHDELGNSYNPDMREDFYRLQRIIETAIPLKVPVLLESQIGPNWGQLKKINLSIQEKTC